MNAGSSRGDRRAAPKWTRRLVELDSAAQLEEYQKGNAHYRATAVFAHLAQESTLAPALPGRFQLRNALTAAIAARLLAERGVSDPRRSD